MANVLALPERIQNFIVPEPLTGCWLWSGAVQDTGYGKVWNGQKPENAHSLVFRLLFGAIADGLELDHRCRVRSCVNPDHLEPVSHFENCRRAVGAGRPITGFCHRGIHEMTPENSYLYRKRDGRLTRRCRACLKAYTRAWNNQRKTA